MAQASTQVAVEPPPQTEPFRQVASTTVSEGGKSKTDTPHDKKASTPDDMGRNGRRSARATRKQDLVAKREPELATPKKRTSGNASSAIVLAASMEKRVKGEDVVRDMLGLPSVVTGSLDEYREGCLKLEKVRHARVYEAEKRRIYHESAILETFQREISTIHEEAEMTRRNATMKALADNMEKIRQVEELRYRICKDELAGGWQRRHEMSLRGRNNGAEEEYVIDDNNKPRRRKADNRAKVKVNVELEDDQVLDDLAEMKGEKRAREEVIVPERRSKKRK